MYALNLIRAIYPIRGYRLFGAADAVVRSLAVRKSLRVFHALMEPWARPEEPLSNLPGESLADLRAKCLLRYITSLGRGFGRGRDGPSRETADGMGSLGRNVNMSLNLNVGIHLNMWVFDGTLDTKEPCLKLRKPPFRV